MTEGDENYPFCQLLDLAQCLKLSIPVNFHDLELMNEDPVVG